MIIKKTELDQLEVTKKLTVQLRFTFQLIEDEEVISSTYHRVSLEKDSNVKEAIGFINTSFEELNKEPLQEDDINLIIKITTCLWG
jgi:hypothetical protein